MVLPLRGRLDSIGRMMVGDFLVGKGCRQRVLGQSPFLQRLQGISIWT